MSAGIDSVCVRCADPRGGHLTVTATRRPRAGRADVKCSVPDAPGIAQRMQQVVRLARHTEARADSRDQVVLSLDRAPAADDRGWELAAVLADRMVRGVLAPKQGMVANGWSDAWHLGRIEGAEVAHLGAFVGQPDPAAGVASARAWFPLHSGGEHDSLGWVEVSVRPLAGPAEDEDAAVAVPELDAVRQAQVRAVLAGSRHFDGRGQGRWRTTVRFGEPRFQGDSYELALVLADRMARGREFLARGRVIATGRSAAWHAGRVDAVDGLAPKCALIAREAETGDRVLLPKDWEAALPPGLREDLRARGASLACVERIGII